MTNLALLEKIAALRAAGDDSFDPVRFRYIEALAIRAQQASEPLNEQLTAKSHRALSNYRNARAAAQELSAASDSAQVQPSAGCQSATVKALAELRQVLDLTQPQSVAGALSLEQEMQAQESTLLQSEMYAASPKPSPSQSAESETSAGPLKSLKASQTMRVHQQRRAVEKRVELAIAEGPESPGPLNPQMLAIKALTMMRELSPQYLNRYVSYLDTLFWVEQLDTAANTKADKKNSRVGGRSKPKKKPR